MKVKIRTKGANTSVFRVLLLVLPGSVNVYPASETIRSVRLGICTLRNLENMASMSVIAVLFNCISPQVQIISSDSAT